MSISTLQNKEKRLLREIESLHNKINKLSKSKQKSALANYLKAQKELAKKMSILTETQQKLSKERKRESDKVKKEQDKHLKELKKQQDEAKRIVSSGISLLSNQGKESDVFISYVQADSSDYVDRLQSALEVKGIEVWRDKSNMHIGQSMTQKIENGLAKSKLAIVILSPNYLHKYWTNAELNGIFSKQGITGEQMIIPIWYNVSAEDIASKRPILADLFAWNVNIDTIESIVESISKILGKGEDEVDDENAN